MITPYEFQQDAIRNHVSVLSKHRFTLEGSKMGLGKTIIAIFTAKALGLTIGVICRAAARDQWVDEIKMCGYEDNVEFVESYDKVRTGKFYACDRVKEVYLYKGKERIRYKFRWKASSPCMLIFDEIQDCNGSTTQNGALLRGAYLNPMIKVMGLSATCATSPLKLDVIGQGLELHRGAGYWRWCLRNGCKKGHFGGLVFNGKEGTRGAEALKIIHRHIFPSRGYRLTYEDIKGQTGQTYDNMIEPVLVDVAKNYERKDLEELFNVVDEAEKEDMRKAAEAGEAPSSLASLIRNRQRDEIALCPWLIENATESNEDGNMVLIFCQYSMTRKYLVKELGYLSFSGEDKKDDKNRVRKLAAENKTQGIVLQIDAGSASLNLQDFTGDMPRNSFILPTYRAETLLQALGRGFRLTSKSGAIQKIVFPSSALGRRIYAAVKEKVSNLELINDGELLGEVFG